MYIKSAVFWQTVTSIPNFLTDKLSAIIPNSVTDKLSAMRYGFRIVNKSAGSKIDS